MAQQVSPYLEAAYGWSFGESGWNSGMDDNLLKFSFLFDRNVDGVVSTLPAAVNGKAYFLTTDNRLYFTVNTTYFSCPTPKWFEFVVRGTGVTYQFNGTSAIQVESLIGVDSRLDAVELSVASLGTASSKDVDFFASTSRVDVVEANAQSTTDRAVQVVGDYAAGLVLSNSNQGFRYLGDIYLPGDGITLPYTTTGVGAAEIANFRSVGDAVLRQDLAATGGASLVGFARPSGESRTVAQKLLESLSVSDYASVQSAVDALVDGGSLYFPTASYNISTPVTMSGKRDITFLGDGARLIQSGARMASFFDCSGALGTVRFEGLYFDQRGSAMPQYVVGDYPATYNVPIIGINAPRVEVENCEFVDLYTTAIKLTGSIGLHATNNVFRSKAQAQTQVIDHVTLTTCSFAYCDGNQFINDAPASADFGVCGIVLSGIRKSSHVSNNFFEYCGRNNAGGHKLGVIDFYYDAENVTVCDNVALNCMSQFMRLNACNHGVVSGNKVHVNGAAEGGSTLLSVESFYFDGGVNNGTKDVRVSNNDFSDPFNRCEAAIGVYAYDWGLPSESVTIEGNSFNGVKFIVSVQGPYKGLSITNNKSRGYYGAIQVLPVTIGTGMTSIYGTEVNCILDAIKISGNVLRNDLGVVSAAISYDSNKSPAFTGQIRDIEISNNTLITPATVAFYAAYLRTPAGAKASIRVSDNYFRFYQNALYVESAEVCSVNNNTCRQNSGAFIVDGGSNLAINRRGNSEGGTTSGGALLGKAVLVAGVVIVSTAEITTGTNISVSRMFVGGSPGQLSVESLIDRVGFTIRSTSATETSTILWEIVK